MCQADVVLAESSGVALIERGTKIYVVDRGTRGLYTVGFVAGLVATIVGINGLVQVALAVTDKSGILVLGAIALAIGILGALAVWRVVVAIRRRRSLPLEQLNVTAIVDRHHAMLCNGANQALVPLANVSVGRKMQFGSSSPALHLSWPAGTLCVVRGSPFAGGVAAVQHVLEQVCGQRR